jgi:ribosomal protein S18 acetylase RimI-like enzyme
MLLTLRAAAESDREFLYDLHCRTMRKVIETTWRWEDAWQRQEFDRRFGEHSVSVIDVDGRRAGGLFVETKPDSLYIHEIQVLPEYQGRGVGTAVLRDVIERAARRGLAVTLSVVSANPGAKRLYERLGFKVTDVHPPFFRMRRERDAEP